MLENVLTLVQAFVGWDTTSAVYGQGKLPILKLLKKFKGAREEASVFLQKDKTSDKICEAEIIFVMLYCGKDSNILIWSEIFKI